MSSPENLVLEKYARSQDKRSRLNKNFNFAFVAQTNYRKELAAIYGHERSSQGGNPSLNYQDVMDKSFDAIYSVHRPSD